MDPAASSSISTCASTTGVSAARTTAPTATTGTPRYYSANPRRMAAACATAPTGYQNTHKSAFPTFGTPAVGSAGLPTSDLEEAEIEDWPELPAASDNPPPVRNGGYATLKLPELDHYAAVAVPAQPDASFGPACAKSTKGIRPYLKIPTSSGRPQRPTPQESRLITAHVAALLSAGIVQLYKGPTPFLSYPFIRPKPNSRESRLLINYSHLTTL